MARANRKEYRAKAKAFALWLLGGKCVHCGTSNQLHFHHVDPNKRETDVTWCFDRTPNYLITEVSKCVLLCFSCHMRLHNIEFMDTATATATEYDEDEEWAF